LAALEAKAPRLLESPSAAQRLTEAAAFLRALPADAGVLLVASTPAAAQWLVALALHENRAQATPSREPELPVRRDARFNWHRRSLSSLLDELALPQLARAGRARVSGLGLLGLCTRLVHRAAEAQTLGRYARVGPRPGFVRALAKTLTELRLARVSVAELAPRDADLARLLSAYEAQLDELALADSAALVHAATEGARKATRFSGLSLLLLDLPLFYSAEAELLGLLAEHSPAVLATVPRGDERAEAHLHLALGARCQVQRREPEATFDLPLLQGRLFAAGGGAGAPQATRGGVELLSSPGESREAVEVARAIQRAAREGVPFDRIAIALRAKDNYSAVVEDALARAAIPAHFAEGVRRPLPEGRALLLLLECARDDLSLAPFAEYLSLSILPRATSDTDEAPLLTSRWERLLREASAFGPSARWQARFAWLRTELTRGFDDPHLEPAERAAAERELTALGALETFALPIVAQLEQLAEARSWGDVLNRLDKLAGDALAAAEDVRELLRELAPLSEVGPVTLSEVARVLAPRLSSMTLRSKGHGAGKVLVATPEELRGRSFAHVFVMGLAEQLFPPRLSEDPLLPDLTRAQLSPELVLAPERAAHERLLLRISVGAAEKGLVLSYPRVDVEHARPRVPSFYGLEVLRAIDGTLPAFDELTRRASQGAAARMGFPAPDAPEHAIDDAEYDLATLSTMHALKPGERVGGLRYLLSHAHLARALRFRARRWTLSRFNAADGFVAQDDAARALLAPYQLGVRAYSASSLAALAACPYRFYLQAVCGLRARAENTRGEALSARERGVLMHRTQQRVLTRLRAAGDLPLGSEGLGEALLLLRATFSELTREEHARRTNASARLLEEGLESLLHDLEEWLRGVAHERAFVPTHFELGFGVKSKPGEIDPDSRPTAITLDQLSLLGVIDLIEQSSARDAHGRLQLRVTDHKSGMPEDKLGPFVSGGRALQPLLYALAVEQMFPEHQVSVGRLSYCTARADFQTHDVPLNDAARAVFRDLVSAVDSLLSQAFLPAAPRKDACKNCTYLPVCGPYEEKERVPQIKAKDLARLQPLFQLRNLP
jgi:ATP-dependent helicase/nuclease subunit B